MTKFGKGFFIAALIFLSSVLSGCGYNNLQAQDEAVKAAWSEVLNQYQRRADLVPNLVKVVQGYAAQEKEVLIQVTNARASVGNLKLSPEILNDPAAMKQFSATQGELSSALSRLLVVSENYPNLKSDTVFRDLNAQLEGTENRIAVARNRFIEQVQAFNTGVRQFPVNLTAKVIGMKPKESFTVDSEASLMRAPTVDFSQPKPAGQ